MAPMIPTRSNNRLYRIRHKNGVHMKTWWLALIPFVAVFTGLGFWVGGAHSTPKALNPAVEVRDVFKAKCAGCHGSDLPKPQGRFGYVLDLRRLAASPEIVIPGRPVESELWQLVEHDEMPPPDAPHGPLTSAEKETIRAWIASGAPE
jgi:mono/diheme cytochrome c family protein